MEAIKKILRTPSAFVLLLVAMASLVGIVIKSKSDESIARIPIDATSTAEARLTQAANNFITPVSSPLASSSGIATLSPNTPVWSPNPILQEKESFPISPVTYRHLSVGYGEIYVGVARRFAIRDVIRDYNFNAMEIKENAPYIVFLIKGPYSLVVGGPTEVDIQISDGEWRHWVNAYDDNWIGGLVIDRVESIRKLPDFSVVGYKEIEIPNPSP